MNSQMKREGTYLKERNREPTLERERENERAMNKQREGQNLNLRALQNKEMIQQMQIEHLNNLRAKNTT